MSSQPGTNPFLSRSDRPFELPPFDEIGDEHYGPAFDAGMAEHRAEVDAIIAQPRAGRPSRTPSSRSSSPGSC